MQKVATSYKIKRNSPQTNFFHNYPLSIINYQLKKSPNVPCDFIFTTCFRRWVRPEGLWASQINLSVHAGFGELVPFYKCVGYKYGKIITNISGIILLYFINYIIPKNSKICNRFIFTIL